METKTTYCINCDNRHGCKSKTPPCLTEMMEYNVKDISGKQYLIESHKTNICKDCPFFRSCWKTEEYNRFN